MAPEVGPLILIVLESTFPVRGGGGAESQVMTLGRRLLAYGFRVEVVVPRLPHGPRGLRDNIHGLAVTRIAYPSVRLLGGVVLLGRLAMLLLRRRREYAVIHAHIANGMAAVASVAGFIASKRVVVKITGMTEMRGGVLDVEPSLLTRLKKRALMRADCVQATSARIAALAVARGFEPDRVLRVPNGVEVKRFDAARDVALRARLCGDAVFVALIVGRLAPEKDHALLLRAWARAFAGRGDVSLILVGDGPLRSVLAQLAAELQIGAQVVFAGNAEDVAPFIAIADVGLLTSLAEGLSNALLEYMAGRLPVIGSRVSGTEDFVVAGQTGWLFEPGDEDELTRCLADAAARAGDGLHEMGARARTKIEAVASVDAVTRTLIGHYGLQGACVAPGK